MLNKVLKDLSYIIHYYNLTFELTEKYGHRGATFSNLIRLFEYNNFWYVVDLSTEWASKPTKCDQMLDFLDFYLYNE